MKKLPIEFDGRADQRGYKFKQLKRCGNVAIYEKINPEHQSGRKFYEVVTIKANPQRRFSDLRVIEAREAMPSSQIWGMGAYAAHDLADAETRFRAMCQN